MGPTLIFETHATSVDNERRIASGWFDVELSALGHEQAVELGLRYRNQNLDAVVCSDLQRSYRTAEIAFADRSLPIVRDARLRECDYGAWTRRPTTEVEAERVGRVTLPFPSGESYAQVAVRTRELLADLRRDWADKRVMIVGHRATWYSLEHLLNRVPLEALVVARWRWQPGWVYTIGVNARPRSRGARCRCDRASTLRAAVTRRGSGDGASARHRISAGAARTFRCRIARRT